MSRDTELKTMSDMGLAIYDRMHSDVTEYRLVLSDWDITGRKGTRKMKFSFRTEIKVGGEFLAPDKYVLTETEECCYESGDLVLYLPRRALTIGE